MGKSNFIFGLIVGAYLLIILTACTTYTPNLNRCSPYKDAYDRYLCRSQIDCESMAIHLGKDPDKCYDNEGRREPDND